MHVPTVLKNTTVSPPVVDEVESHDVAPCVTTMLSIAPPNRAAVGLIAVTLMRTDPEPSPT